jgi:hypothetical protein
MNPIQPRGDATDSWFERHPMLTLILLLGGAALALWFLFLRNRGVAQAASQLQLPIGPEILVSPWSPLQ